MGHNGGHRHFRTVLLHITLVNPLVYTVGDTHCLHALDVLRSDNIPLLSKVGLSARDLGGLRVHRHLTGTTRGIHRNGDVRLSLRRATVFPPVVLCVITSNRGDKRLNALVIETTSGRRALRRGQVTLALSVFRPTLVVAVTLVILFVIISMLRPLLRLGSVVGWKGRVHTASGRHNFALLRVVIIVIVVNMLTDLIIPGLVNGGRGTSGRGTIDSVITLRGTLSVCGLSGRRCPAAGRKLRSLVRTPALPPLTTGCGGRNCVGHLPTSP